MTLPISLIYERNIKGPSTVPCGTPDVTLAVLDLSPSMVTCCSRCVSHASSHDRMFPFMPYDSSFFSRRLCGTVSKALLKSNMSISTWWLLSRFLALSSVVMTSCYSHDRLFLKPCWKSTSMLCLSRWFIICLNMTCSMILQGTDVNDTGR